jgi:exonuclease III
VGFKFHEIKSWLLEGKFDILVVSETKLDMSFPKSQFYIHGFRLQCIDRNGHRGGLMVYIRADICSSVFKDHTGLSTNEWGNFKTEFIAVKVKLKKEWVIVVSYAYLLSGLCPHVRYAYFGQEFLSSKLANHSFIHENCGA